MTSKGSSLSPLSYLMEIFSQDKFLEVSRGGRRGSDSLPHFVFAVSKVVGSHSWHESVVPEHEGLQRQAPVHNCAHCCHLVDNKQRTLKKTSHHDVCNGQRAKIHVLKTI